MGLFLFCVLTGCSVKWVCEKWVGFWFGCILVSMVAGFGSDLNAPSGAGNGGFSAGFNVPVNGFGDLDAETVGNLRDVLLQVFPVSVVDEVFAAAAANTGGASVDRVESLLDDAEVYRIAENRLKGEVDSEPLENVMERVGVDVSLWDDWDPEQDDEVVRGEPGCDCSCHFVPGVKHVQACCFPNSSRVGFVEG